VNGGTSWQPGVGERRDDRGEASVRILKGKRGPRSSVNAPPRPPDDPIRRGRAVVEKLLARTFASRGLVEYQVEWKVGPNPGGSLPSAQSMWITAGPRLLVVSFSKEEILGCLSLRRDGSGLRDSLTLRLEGAALRLAS
jgi:hypothetical protein